MVVGTQFYDIAGGNKWLVAGSIFYIYVLVWLYYLKKDINYLNHQEFLSNLFCDCSYTSHLIDNPLIVEL